MLSRILNKIAGKLDHAVRARSWQRKLRRTLLARFGSVEEMLEEARPTPESSADETEIFLRRSAMDASFFPFDYKFQYWRCKDSGLIYLSPRLRAGVLEYLYTDVYTTHVLRADPATVSKKSRDAESYANAVAEVAPPAKFPRLLDVGCGHGYFVHAATAMGYEASGQEFADFGPLWKDFLGSADVVQRTRLSDRQAFPAGSFDIVTLWEVAEHLLDPVAEFTAIQEILAPGGYLILESPRADSAAAVLLKSKWGQFIPEQHTYLFSARSIRGLLEGCGFIVERIEFSRSPREAFHGRIHVVAKKPAS